LQCVAVCCSVLQCVAVCCWLQSTQMSKFRIHCSKRCAHFCLRHARRCSRRISVLQCVAVCCSVLQCVAVCYVHTYTYVNPVLKALCAFLLEACEALLSSNQCVAVCCSVLQCVAVCYRVLYLNNIYIYRCQSSVQSVM